MTLKDIVKQTLEARLLEKKGNIVQASKSLGINRNTLYKNLPKEDIKRIKAQAKGMK